MLRKISLLSSLISCYLALLVSNRLPAQEKVQDPVERLLNLYALANEELQAKPLASTKEEREYYELWLGRFVECIKKFPKNAMTKRAMWEAVGLANGVQNYQQSLQLLSQLAEHESDPGTLLRLYREIGELAGFRLSTEPAKKEALEILKKARAIGAALAEKSNFNQTDRDNYISALVYLGQLTAAEMKHHGEAAELYLEARKQALLLDTHERHTLTESLAREEMEERVRGGDIAGAKKVLEDIAVLAKKIKMRWHPSGYALTLGQRIDPRCGTQFEDFAADWLKRHSKDEETPFLLAYYARSLFRQGRYLDALPIYLDLKEHHAKTLLGRDAAALRTQDGGYYPEVLCNLAFIYLETGKVSLARPLAKEFETLVPRDLRLPRLKEAVASTVEVSTTQGNGSAAPGETTAPERSWGAFVTVNGVVVGLVVAIGCLKRFRKKCG